MEGIVHFFYSQLLRSWWSLSTSSAGYRFGIKDSYLLETRNYPSPVFLVADTQLYKRLCPSVRPLVGRSVDTSKSEERSVLEHF